MNQEFIMMAYGVVILIHVIFFVVEIKKRNLLKRGLQSLLMRGHR